MGRMKIIEIRGVITRKLEVNFIDRFTDCSAAVSYDIDRIHLSSILIKCNSLFADQQSKPEAIPLKSINEDPSTNEADEIALERNWSRINAVYNDFQNLPVADMSKVVSSELVTSSVKEIAKPLMEIIAHATSAVPFIGPLPLICLQFCIAVDQVFKNKKGTYQCAHTFSTCLWLIHAADFSICIQSSRDWLKTACSCVDGSRECIARCSS